MDGTSHRPVPGAVARFPTTRTGSTPLQSGAERGRWDGPALAWAIEVRPAEVPDAHRRSLRSGAARREYVQKALKVVHIERWGRRAAVAVGVRVNRRELIKEALKVIDVEYRRGGGGITVGVTGCGDRQSPEQGLEALCQRVHSGARDIDVL